MTHTRLRFAPSPTGRIHLGNARGALVNWLHARRNGGRLLLRLDDTDRQRSTEEFAQAIQDDLLWLGLGWDEFVRQSDRLERYAAAIGLAFQVVDDILDVVGDAAALGKTAGKDADDGKPTYVSTLGLDASRRLADDLLAQARAAVAALGPGARRLGEIAELIVTRHS